MGIIPAPADVSLLALEATLTAIKGAGWTTETLKAIKDAVDAIIPGVGDATQVKQDAIKAVVDAIKAVTDLLPDGGTLNDLAIILTAIQHATYGLAQLRIEIDANETKIDTIDGIVDTLLTRITAAVATASGLSTHDTDIKNLLAIIASYLTTEIADILTDTGTTLPGLLSTIQADLDNPGQYKANLSTLETRLSAARAGYLDELDFDLQAKLLEIDAEVEGLGGAAMRGTNNAALAVDLEDAMQKATGPAYNQDTDSLEALREAIDAISGAVSTDWKGSFNWDTSAYTSVEQDISALFSTNLALTTRRKYSVKLDLTAVETDGNFTELYLAVKEKIDGTNYRAIDRKTITKAQIAATAEPGIPIIIPATSENIQITMQMSVALASDRTIYYAVVKEHLE